jgi:putative Mg2+ transporter-C (MgtC) family protein
MPMAIDVVLLRLLVSLLLGAVIGAEREWNHHAAGLKTNALVALGAAIFVMFGGAVAGADSLARVGAQVVTGIGFLGGGIILREGLNDHGLNTAATLWCSASVGVLAGAGLYGESVLAAGAVFAVNLGLRQVAMLVTKFAARRERAAVRYTITVTSEPGPDAEIRRAMIESIGRSPCHPRNLQVSSFGAGDRVESRAMLSLPARDDPTIEGIATELGRLAAGARVSWSVEPAPE